MKNKGNWFSKYGKLVLSLALLVLVTIGGTFAWLNRQAAVKNVLTAHTVSVGVLEDFPDHDPSGTKKKEVAFQNTGSADAFLRVSYEESWKKKENGEYFLLPTDTGAAVKNWTTAWTEEWEDGGDGWYYYKKVLKTGTDTEKILTGVTFDYTGANARYDGGEYDLFFQAEVVQASTGSTTLNSPDVNLEASETVFGRKAAIGSDGVTVTWTTP